MEKTQNKTNVLETIGKIICFQGNQNRLWFLGAAAIAEITYALLLDIVIDYKLYRFHDHYLLTYVAFCYLWGICITGRIRNLRLNPSLAYFFVIGLWAAHFVFLREYNVSTWIPGRNDILMMLQFFIILPLLAKDKKTLQFWKE